jgi:energy-coupling factor transport system ATP-binding protein
MAALPPAAPRATPGLGDTLVETKGLTLAHGRAVAVRTADLAVREGEIVAVMGRNGAGKTTLLRALAGVHAPLDGAVWIQGHAPRPGVDVALCPQEPDAVLFADSVREEVAITLRARGHDPSLADSALDDLGIAALARTHPRDCSAGQRLLVAVAATCAGHPPVLLLDEPTRGLDSETKALLASFLRSHAAAGGAVLVATHDVELAAAAATRVVMLAGGDVVADGEAGHVLGDSHVFAPQMTRAFGPGWLTPEQVAVALA